MIIKKISPKINALMILFTLFLIITIPNAQAQDFTVEHKNINYQISFDEVAQHNLTITNLLDRESRYSFSLSLGDTLNWVSFPANIRIPAQSTESIILNLAPKTTTPIGVYQVNIIVRSEQSEKEVPLPVHLSYDGLFFDFVPNVETILVLPQTVDPRNSARITVRLRNRNPLNIEEAELRIRSELFNGNQEIKITPGPHRTLQEAIVKELVFPMDPLQRPGEYEVRALIYYPKTDRIISEDVGTIIVEGYSTTPTRLDTEKKLFVTTNTITIENFGNREAVAEVKLAANYFKKLFSTMTHEAEYEQVNGESNFLWTITLEPTERVTIEVKTNYWPLAITLAIITLLILLYFKLRSPVVMQKEAAIIDEDKGEGSSDIRIRLFIKNRTGSTVKNITISDKVRGITEYVESTQLGHVKPTRTTKTSKKGTMLYWDLDELEPYEERIFTYKLKSKLKVVGELSLPKATAKFETIGHRERRIKSSPPFFKKIKKKKQK